MNFYVLSSLITFITTTSLAILVFILNWKNKVNLAYALANLSVSFWSLFYIFWQTSNTYNSAFNFLKLLMYGATFMPVFLFHFILCYLNFQRSKRVLLYIIYFAGISFLFGINFNLLFSSLKSKAGFDYWPDAGPIMPLYLLFFFGIIAYSMFLLYQDLQKSSGLKRTRNRYLFSALLIAIFAGSPNYALWYNIPIKPIFNSFFAIYVVLIAYAILAHQLFDIQVIIRRGIIYSTLTAILFSIFAFFLLVLPQLFWQSGFFFVKPWFLGLIASAIIVLTFRPLEKLIAEVTDFIFFQGRYDFRKEVERLNSAIIEIATVEKMSERIIENLVRPLKLSGAGVYIFNAFDRVYKPTSVMGNLEGLRGMEFGIDFWVFEYFRQRFEEPYLTVEGVEKEYKEIGEAIKEKERAKRRLEKDPFTYHAQEGKYPQYDNFRIDELKERREKVEVIKERMKGIRAELIIPIRTKEEIFGFLFFSEKKSSDPFSQEDLQFLKAITPQIGIALENSHLHDELQKEIKASHYHLDRAERLATLGTFALGVAHEIRNPLNSINIWAEVVEKNPDDKKAMARFVEVFKENVLRIDRVLDSMKYFGTPAHEEKEEIRMVKIIEDVLVMTSELRRKSMIKVKVDYCGLENETIYGNDYSLHQVIFNLVINAIDAIKEKKEGEGLISFVLNNAQLSFAEQSQEALEIVIKDNGCGIKEENLHKIFDPMFTTKKSGSGLGLGIVHRIVNEEHHGQVKVESREGKGTTFKVILLKKKVEKDDDDNLVVPKLKGSVKQGNRK